MKTTKTKCGKLEYLDPGRSKEPQAASSCTAESEISLTSITLKEKRCFPRIAPKPPLDPPLPPRTPQIYPDFENNHGGG